MIDKQITKYFERRSTPRATRTHSGKVPASQLHKAVGCENQQELISYLTGVEKPVSRRLERIFALGHAIESLVMGDLRNNFVVENEQRVLENSFLKGAVDLTIRDKDGNIYIADIKSMNDTNYSAFIRGAVPHYIQVQMMCYIYLWRSTINAPIMDDAIIIGYNKNDSRVKAVKVEYNESFINTFIKQAEKIFYNIKEGKT